VPASRMTGMSPALSRLRVTLQVTAIPVFHLQGAVLDLRSTVMSAAEGRQAGSSSLDGDLLTLPSRMAMSWGCVKASQLF